MANEEEDKDSSFNQLMRDMYSGATEEERRAMLKSFVCLLLLLEFFLTVYFSSKSREERYCLVIGKMYPRVTLTPSRLLELPVSTKIIFEPSKQCRASWGNKYRSIFM